jgi:hypothetical protein
VSTVTKTCGDYGGVNKAGEPCGLTLGLNERTGLCIQHDPERAEERRAQVKRGGEGARITAWRNKLEKMTTAPENLPTDPPDTLERLASWHIWAAGAVATGEIDARTADSICRHLQQLRPTLLNLGFEKRLKQYEQAVAHWKKTGKPDRLLALVGKDGDARD